MSSENSLLEGGSLVPNHKPADMILRQKIGEAEKHGIEVIYDIFMPSKISIDYTTLCMVLGNALDNAVEACLKVDGEKKICINIFNVQNTFTIKILNTSNHVEIIGDEIKTTKPEKQIHGLGLSNMKRVVKEYGGNMVINYNEGIFSLYIIFPL